MVFIIISCILKMVFIIMSCILITFLLVYFIMATIYHLDSDVRYGQKISFRQYLRISSVAPEKWYIRDGCYCYLVYNKDADISNRTEVYMRTYFDHLRLCLLYEKEKKKDIDEIWTQERMKLIKSWQEDINKYHDNYLEQIGVYLKKGRKI